MHKSRRKWVSPELTRLVAGRAEGTLNTTVCDNGNGSCNGNGNRRS